MALMIADIAPLNGRSFTIIANPLLMLGLIHWPRNKYKTYFDRSKVAVAGCSENVVTAEAVIAAESKKVDDFGSKITEPPIELQQVSYGWSSG